MKTAIRKKRTLALIRLMDDPDRSVHEAVEKELLKEDSRIIPALEEVWESTLDEICQDRIESLIQQIQFREKYRKLSSWVKQNPPDLLEGFLLISRYHYPDLSAEKIERKIEEIRKKVWVELNNSLTSLEKITVLNHIFFNNFGYSVNHINPSSPHNCFINQLIETGKGNPVAISMLYTVVAQRLELPIHFIDFPKNPLLAFVDRKIAQKVHPKGINTDVLFYINPANKGSITGRRELEFHLKRMNYEPYRKYFEASGPRRFLLRLLETLEKAYESNGFADKASDIRLLTGILSEED